MRTACALAVVLMLAGVTGRAIQQTPPARDPAVQPTVGSGSIAGQVVNDEEQPKPVRRAIVSLAGDQLRPSRGAITDDEGRFTIANLPAGRFSLTVTRASFITSVYGAKRPGRPGTPISVADGERVTGLVVKAWRGAAIAGVLRDDTGAPVEGIAVTTMRAGGTSGQTVLSLSNNPATTNDLGEFRIFGLLPGTYVISASPSSGGGGPMRAMSEAEVDAAFSAVRSRTSVSPGAPAAEPPLPRPFAYAPIFFPGTPVLAQATTITLSVGQEQTGVDFSLQRVQTAIVEGSVTRSDGQSAAGTTVQMAAVAPPGPFTTDSPLVLNATSGPDGRFQIAQVPPGEYKLIARGPITPGPAGAPHWATADLSIGGSDVSGVGLTLEPGATLTGRIRFESDTLKPPADLTRVRFTLVPTSVLAQRPGTSVRTIAFAPPVNLRADGSFELIGMPPGTYGFQFSGVDTSSWWARSAVLGERDLLDGHIEVGRGAMTGVVVTFTDRRTELTGTLQSSAGAPASDVFVVAFATDRKLLGPGTRRVQSARPSVDGRFTIKDLPPGEYFLGAVTDVDLEELRDPAFLEKIVPASLKVTIGEGEKKVQDLRIGGG